MGEKGRPLIAGRGKQDLRRDRRGAGPERANTPEPKRKAGVDPAAAQGRGVPSKPSTFSGVVYNGPKPGGAAVREGAWAGTPACIKHWQRLTQCTRGTRPTKTWHSVGHTPTHGAQVPWVFNARYWKRDEGLTYTKAQCCLPTTTTTTFLPQQLGGVLSRRTGFGT